MSSLTMLVLLLLCMFNEMTSSLRLTDITFPEHVMLGQTVTMVCDYRLDDGEHVDSIKWYKDGREFYRILPNNARPEERLRKFPVEGINLDMYKSGLMKQGMHQITLQDVTLNSSGTYRCQITESRPPFHTEQKDRNLSVIIRPESGPQIMSLKLSYNIDETIDIMCISKRSFPASRLDFFINDEQIDEKLKTRYPVQHHADGLLQSATIGLQYPITRGNHHWTELRFKCTAKIGNAYWESVEQKTTVKRLGMMLESRANGATEIAWSPCLLSLSLALIALGQLGKV